VKPDDEDGSTPNHRSVRNWRAPILQEILTCSRWALSRLTRSSQQSAEETLPTAAQSLNLSSLNDLPNVSLDYPLVSTKSAKSEPLNDPKEEEILSPTTSTVTLTPSKKRTGKTSEYFNKPSPQKKIRSLAGTVSCLEIAPLWDSKFGLIQEEFAHDPFNLLIAVVFLNKTKGSCAIPIFRQILEMYPTPQQLAEADAPTLTFIIQTLGLQNQRAKILIGLAKSWTRNPPAKGRRHRTLHYPYQGAAQDIKIGEILSDDDQRPGAWEIGHLPGLGPYAFDSWRIFCRDKLRGLANGWNGEGTGPMFEPEWKRVVPKDKELRAILKWMWLKEGWAWNPISGDKEVASEELMQRAEKGGFEWDAGADRPRETNPQLSDKIDKLGIIQSLPKDEVQFNKNEGAETIQGVKEGEDPHEDSDDANSGPDRFGPGGSGGESSSSSSHFSDHPENSDSSEDESEEESASNEPATDDPEITRSKTAIPVDEELGEEESEDERSEDDELRVEAPKAKRRKLDVEGNNTSLPSSKLSSKHPEGKYRCTVSGCNKTFATNKSRKRHLQSIHDKDKFICTLCGASLSRKDKLTNHMNKIHAAQKDSHCSECEDSFWTTDLLNRHVRLVHRGLKSFECIICDIELSRKDKFDQHLLTARHKANALEQEKNRDEDEQSTDVNIDHATNILEHDQDIEGAIEQPSVLKCRVCDVRFSKKSKLQRHFGTAKHARNVLERKDVEPESGDGADEAGEREEIDKAEVFKWTVCNVELSRRDKLEKYALTAKHARNVAEQESAKKEGKKRVAVDYDSEVFGEDIQTDCSHDEED
jgi:methyl-CpG-binding domain protein 4